MQCKNCGRDVKSDFKYCPYCANRLINDFEDHYGELDPPYVMSDMTDQEPDASAFLYGRARVIPDETDAFFAPEKTAASKENAEMQSATSREEDRPLPYEIYRPVPIDHMSDIPLPEEDFAPETELHHPPREVFRANLPDDLPDDFADLPDLPDEDFVLEHEASRAPFDEAPYEQLPMQELKWETQLPDDAPEVQSNKTLEDAPYVAMQPDVEEQATHPRVAVQNPGPSVAIKLLLILFMVLLGVLASFLLYQFWGNFNNAHRVETVSSAVASCWQQAWRGHYFL